MQGMGQIQGTTLDAFNAQTPAIEQASKGLEGYHSNLGMLMKRVPLVIPMVQAQTQAMVDQAAAEEKALERKEKMQEALGVLEEAVYQGSMAMVQASAQSGISFKKMAQIMRQRST